MQDEKAKLQKEEERRNKNWEEWEPATKENEVLK
jgi:hypothetical protein